MLHTIALSLQYTLPPFKLAFMCGSIEREYWDQFLKITPLLARGKVS